MVSKEAEASEFYGRAERRIGWLTLVLGLGAAIAVARLVSSSAGAGIAAGTVLAWFNYRWLESFIDALVRVSSAPEETPRPRVSAWAYLKFFGRYVLIGSVLYVMVARFAIPILSILSGLLALGAAAMAEAIYEIFLEPD